MENIKQTVAKGFFWVFLTSALIYLIQFVIKIFLARLLSPGDFGVMAIAIFILGFVNLFQDFGLGNALVQKQKNIEESFDSSFVFILIFSVLNTIILLLFSKQLAVFFNDVRIESVIFFIALTVPLGAVIVPCYAFVSKNLMFFRRFVIETIPLFLGSLVSLGLALFNFGYLSLVFGYITGTAVYALLLFLLTPLKLKLKFDTVILREMIGYSKYILFSNFLAVIVTQGDNFVIGKILDSTQLGFYAFAYSLATLPSVNVAHAISKVIFPTFSKLQNDLNALKNSFLKSFGLMCGVILPMCVGAVIISPFLFNAVLGGKWLPAQIPFVILVVLAFFRAVIVIPSYFLQGTGHSKADSNISFVSVIIMLVFIFPVTYKFGIIGVCVLMTFMFFLSALFYTVKCAGILDVSFLTVIKTFLKPIFASVAMAVTSIFFIEWFGLTHTVANMFVVIFFSIFMYVFMMYFINKELFIEVKLLLKESINHAS